MINDDDVDNDVERSREIPALVSHFSPLVSYLDPDLNRGYRYHDPDRYPNPDRICL